MKKLSVALLSVVVGAHTALADRLEDMISPAFHPVTFEDPRAITEARLLYVHHQIDGKFVTGGGNVNVYALQLRYAVSDDFALIATKDGFVDFNPNGALNDGSGLADIEVGAKYALYRDSENGRIVTGILRYTIPTGDNDVLQGQGNGEIHPSLSAATALSDSLTLTVDGGMRIPTDSDYSTFMDADVQLDYKVPTSFGSIYPLVGASLIHVVDAGNNLPIADEGQDFFNLGASQSNGENFVLGTVGARYRPCTNFDVGVSYQFPFDSGEGNRIIASRTMFDAIYRF